jgi:N-acetylglucosaminyldiphosphoundecaprenol N-acetyl-beta-D-mannosaminyltransferase
LRSREIIGTTVALTDYDEVLGAIDEAVETNDHLYICCAPASSLVFARDDPALRFALDRAAIVTPDGMGVVYAARLLGEAIKDRVYGPDLMLAQCARAAANGQRIWLYGGFDESALAALRDALVKRFPGLQIAGSHSPPHRPLTPDEADLLTAKINRDAPDIVWVGLGSPKQEIWMHDIRADLSAPVLCGVGAAFDFIAGRVPQAPRWAQRVGIEWAYRLMREPRRLGRRYLRTLPRFALLVMRQRLTARG